MSPKVCNCSSLATFTIKKNPFFIDELDDDDSGIVLKVKSKDADSIGAVDIIEEEHGTYRVTYVPQTPGTLSIIILSTSKFRI